MPENGGLARRVAERANNLVVTDNPNTLEFALVVAASPWAIKLLGNAKNTIVDIASSIPSDFMANLGFISDAFDIGERDAQFLPYLGVAALASYAFKRGVIDFGQYLIHDVGKENRSGEYRKAFAWPTVILMGAIVNYGYCGGGVPFTDIEFQPVSNTMDMTNMCLEPTRANYSGSSDQELLTPEDRPQEIDLEYVLRRLLNEDDRAEFASYMVSSDGTEINNPRLQFNGLAGVEIGSTPGCLDAHNYPQVQVINPERFHQLSEQYGRNARTRYEPGSQEAVQLFRDALSVLNIDADWENEFALHASLGYRSNGYVGRVSGVRISSSNHDLYNRRYADRGNRFGVSWSDAIQVASQGRNIFQQYSSSNQQFYATDIERVGFGLGLSPFSTYETLASVPGGDGSLGMGNPFVEAVAMAMDIRKEECNPQNRRANILYGRAMGDQRDFR